MKKFLIVALFLTFLGFALICNLNNEKTETSLIVKSTIELSVPEPSGLFFEKETKTFWTVSDENSTVYNLDMEGKVLKNFKVDEKDLEGITLINDSTLAVVLERDRSILVLDKNGNELKRINLNISGELNKGLEGITYDHKKDQFILVNEKKPKSLFKVDNSGKIIEEVKFSFAKDLSGIYYSNSTNIFWIISDEDKSVFKCSSNGDVISSYKVNIEQIEGIAIDEESSILYLVSDPLNKLYVCDLL